MVVTSVGGPEITLAATSGGASYTTFAGYTFTFGSVASSQYPAPATTATPTTTPTSTSTSTTTTTTTTTVTTTVTKSGKQKDDFVTIDTSEIVVQD